MWARFVILALSVLAVSCGKPDRTVRNYKEIRFSKQGTTASAMVNSPSTAPVTNAPAPSASRMGDLPPEALGDKLPLAWDVPEGWESLGASGIRIATFRVQGQECTILSFPGDVGGDEANIRRWFGQINQSPSDEAIKQLIGSPKTAVTTGGFNARLYDFADILPAGAPTSTLAGIIPVGEQTVFVKLAGDAAVLSAQKDAFEVLCLSIRLQEGATPAYE